MHVFSVLTLIETQSPDMPLPGNRIDQRDRPTRYGYGFIRVGRLDWLENRYLNAVEPGRLGSGGLLRTHYYADDFELAVGRYGAYALAGNFNHHAGTDRVLQKTIGLWIRFLPRYFPLAGRRGGGSPTQVAQHS